MGQAETIKIVDAFIQRWQGQEGGDGITETVRETACYAGRYSLSALSRASFASA